ncbi:MAG: PspC domain-containing protein [Turicibacter sp.]|nr:PspC domain-containing protein [Turicibacter sp.]
MEEKRLRRNEKNAILGGVCSGVGEYLGIDAVFIRLGVVILGFATVASGLLLYAAAWLLIPKKYD